MSTSKAPAAVPHSFIQYIQYNERLARLLMELPITNPHSKEYQELIKTPGRKKPLIYAQDQRSSDPTAAVINNFAKAQHLILALAKEFAKDEREFFLEHPNIFLPLATLPAVQNLSLLTPGNYAEQVTRLLHDVFRRLFPGASFRKRKKGVMLCFNSNALKRSHTFYDFMQKDNYWSTFLQEKNPNLQQATTKFHDAHVHLNHFLLSSEYENMVEVVLNESNVMESVYIKLPNFHTIPKYSLRDKNGQEHHYLKFLNIEFISKLIANLSNYASYNAVLASAYPVLKAQAAAQHKIVSAEEAAKNGKANDFMKLELASRVVTIPQAKIDALSGPLREYVEAAITDDNRMFLPITDRGFKNYGAHHIYVEKNPSTSHLYWTPLPPIEDAYKTDLMNGRKEYLYQGISEQTSYIVDSPRSTHGKSPHVFNSLLYTAIHAPFYNRLLLEQYKNYDLSPELKQLMVNALFPLPELSYSLISDFYTELDLFVTDLLFSTEEAAATPTT